MEDLLRDIQTELDRHPVTWVGSVGRHPIRGSEGIGKLQPAIEIRRTIEARNHFLHGWNDQLLGDLDSAAVHLRLAILMDDQYRLAWYRLSAVERELGNNNAAFEAWTRSLLLHCPEAADDTSWLEDELSHRQPGFDSVEEFLVAEAELADIPMGRTPFTTFHWSYWKRLWNAETLELEPPWVWEGLSAPDFSLCLVTGEGLTRDDLRGQVSVLYYIGDLERTTRYDGRSYFEEPAAIHRRYDEAVRVVALTGNGDRTRVTSLSQSHDSMLEVAVSADLLLERIALMQEGWCVVLDTDGVIRYWGRGQVDDDDEPTALTIVLDQLTAPCADPTPSL